MTQRRVQGERSLRTEPPWWMRATFYRIDVRLFCDTNLDGVGDIDGLRQRLGYVELLGVDALWLYSPFAAALTDPEHGREMDPLLGTLESFEDLIAEAHASGIRVTVDVSAKADELDSPAQRERLAENLRFWLDLGLDGLRLSATPGRGVGADDTVHDMLRLVRPVVNEYPNRALGVFVDDDWFARYTAPPDWDIGVDLRLGDTEFDADRIQGVIDQILYSTAAVGVPPVWTVTDRDQIRPVIRYGGGPTGVARARAIALVVLALPGVVGLDNGEELALPGPHAADPAAGRGPMVWEGDQPPFGFSQAPGTWWPITEEWAGLTVEAQLEDPESTLTLYQRALELRSEHPAFAGDRIEWFGAPPGCFAFRRSDSDLTCALNTSAEPVELPPGEVLLASGPLPEGKLPGNTAAWLA